MKRWDDLKAQFERDNLRVCRFLPHPLICYLIACGVTSLKTRCHISWIILKIVYKYHSLLNFSPVRRCDIPLEMSNRCPTCSPLVTSIRDRYPFVHRPRSTLICRISGDVMDEHNPPLVFPNGQSYSHNVYSSIDTHWWCPIFHCDNFFLF